MMVSVTVVAPSKAPGFEAEAKAVASEIEAVDSKAEAKAARQLVGSQGLTSQSSQYRLRRGQSLLQYANNRHIAVVMLPHKIRCILCGW